MTGLEGDEVKVLAEDSTGCWMVRINDKVGWFPSNYLLPAEQPEGEEESQDRVESDVDEENEDEDEDDDAERNETRDEGNFEPSIDTF